MGISIQLKAPVAVLPSEITSSTYGTKDLVGSRDGLDMLEKKIILNPIGNRKRIPCLSTC